MVKFCTGLNAGKLLNGVYFRTHAELQFMLYSYFMAKMFFFVNAVTLIQSSALIGSDRDPSRKIVEGTRLLQLTMDESEYHCQPYSRIFW